VKSAKPTASSTIEKHLNLCIVEPWFGESHATLFRGIAEHTRHHAALVTLPARKWRWRMRFGAVHLRGPLAQLKPAPDVLLVSDYVNLPVLRGFNPNLSTVPTAVYFLENQLTYPTRHFRARDFEFMAANLLTCLLAEAVVFCSKQHKEAMLEATLPFLKHDPTGDIEIMVQEIEEKSTVIPIGVDLDRFDAARNARADRTGHPLRIVWPHRFEHDKNPQTFFEVVSKLDTEGLPFELTIVGRSYRDTPSVLLEMRETLSHRIVQFGFLEGDAYAEALAASDVVVSTAFQETQGIAVIEAIRAGCDPLLPNRLSYPEVLGPRLSEKHLYKSTGDLRRRLRWMMRHPDRVRNMSNHWKEMERFGWSEVASQFDALFERLVAERGRVG
jgi:glycosyltransferase involved in cell wall biosynthesis